MMRILLICYILLQGLADVCQCQDLVPNGDFEKPNLCYEYLARCSPKAWFNSHKYGGHGYNHPPTVAASGKEYLSLVAAAPPKDKRDYWETMLLCPLEPGQLYHVSLSISADKVGPNVNDIGFYFTDDFIFSLHDSLFQPDAGVLEFRDAKVHRLPNGWFSIKKDFRPSNSAQFLIIGNFSRKTNAELIRDRRDKDSVVRIFVDDVSVVKEGGTPCARMDKIRDSLFAIRSRHPKDTVFTLKADTAAYAVDNKPDTIRLDDILFEFGRSAFRDPSVLEKYRRYFSDTTMTRLEVVGFADDAGSMEYNVQLSLDRARTVAGIIEKMFRIPASRIRIAGKGISTQYADKSRNRRVEIYIYHRTISNSFFNFISAELLPIQT
jgi:flagellar motor protein MotB